MDTGVDAREQRRMWGTVQGDVRVVMKAKPKPKGDHAKASTGGGARRSMFADGLPMEEKVDRSYYLFAMNL